MKAKKTKCQHIFRSGQLHPSIKIGGVSLGECQNPALAGFVVCFDHVDKASLSLMLRMKEKELRAAKREIKSLEGQLEKFYLL